MSIKIPFKGFIKVEQKSKHVIQPIFFSDHSSHFTKLLSEVSWIETEGSEESPSIDVIQQLLGRVSVQSYLSTRLSEITDVHTNSQFCSYVQTLKQAENFNIPSDKVLHLH